MVNGAKYYDKTPFKKDDTYTEEITAMNTKIQLPKQDRNNVDEVRITKHDSKPPIQEQD